MEYDIAIIGLGPAGANFARLIDSSMYTVAAIDKKSVRFPQKHSKPCGGLLSPSAQRSLAKFNLSIPSDIIASPQIFYVKTIDLDNKITNNYQRFYINIDRQKFDLWLMSIIPESVAVFDDATVIKIEEANGYYNITFRREGKTVIIRSKYLIGADGARSITSKHIFNIDERNYRLSIQEWYPEDNQKPFFSCIFDSENCDSYSWSLSKDGYFIFGGAYNIKTAKMAFEKQKNKLLKNGFSISSPLKREACLIYKLRSLHDFHLGVGRVLLIGEAAGFISPSSYEGISGALDSSFHLSAVFNLKKKDILAHYKKSTMKLRLKFLTKIIKTNILNNKYLRRLIMKSKIKNINVIDN